MKNRLLPIVLSFGLLFGAAVAAESNLYGFKTKTLEGKPVDLSQYKGKVALVVNVASSCGFTPQYEGLEGLYKELSPKGLVVLGFPSNDFGEQEPGSPAEIRTFCSTKYHVTFPMFAKVAVTGPSQAPLYKYLSETTKQSPSWNFCKYLVNRQGKVVKFYKSTTKPDSAELRTAIETELKAK
jgi:glutathione peroxidase